MAGNPKIGVKGVKVGGRASGTPNKRNRDIQDLLKKACPGFDPVVAMARVAYYGQFQTRDVETGQIAFIKASTDQRVNCLKEVAKYVHPQLKAVEHSGAIDTTITSGVLRVPELLTEADWLNEAAKLTITRSAKS